MENLLDLLSEDNRNHPVMARFSEKTPDDLAKSYIELNRLQSGSVKIPTKDSPKEDWEALPEKFAKNGVHLTPVPDWEDEAQVAAFRKAIGVPEKPEEYEVGIEDLEDDAAERFRKMAADLGMTKAQAKKFFAEMDAMGREFKQAQDMDANEQTEALKLAWGADKDKRIARIMKVAEAEVGQEVTLNAAGMMLVDKLLQKLEGTAQGHELSEMAKDPGDTIAELEQKMNDLRAKMQAPEYQTSPDRAADRARWQRYQAELERLKSA